MTDMVNHPPHYTGFSNGAEVIDIVEGLSYCRGAAVKYLVRAGVKDADKEIEDLKKAAWYVAREIARLESGRGAAENLEVRDYEAELYEARSTYQNAMLGEPFQQYMAPNMGKWGHDDTRCDAYNPDDEFTCSRDPGHTGSHIATTAVGEPILDVWYD